MFALVGAQSINNDYLCSAGAVLCAWPCVPAPAPLAGSGRRELEAVSLADMNPLGRDERRGSWGLGSEQG